MSRWIVVLAGPGPVSLEGPLPGDVKATDGEAAQPVPTDPNASVQAKGGIQEK